MVRSQLLLRHMQPISACATPGVQTATSEAESGVSKLHETGAERSPLRRGDDKANENEKKIIYFVRK